MKTNDFSVRERHALAYSTPTVNILNLHSEGVLCGSYDTPGAGYDDENKRAYLEYPDGRRVYVSEK